MFELIETRPDCSVQEAEYIRLLGYPPHRTLEDRSRELADWARDWFAKHGRPWIYAREASDVGILEKEIQIGGAVFHSRLLREQFTNAQVNRVVVVAVSAGRECEEHAQELWTEGKPDEYFFLEMFASAVVEHLIALAHGRICGWADSQGLAALPHHSPGYSGWNVSEQNRFWELLQTGLRGPMPGELHVMESGMLQPKKSLLALVGLASNHFAAAGLAKMIPCKACALLDCQYRRAPHRRANRVAVRW